MVKESERVPAQGNATTYQHNSPTTPIYKKKKKKNRRMSGFFEYETVLQVLLCKQLGIYNEGGKDCEVYTCI